MRKIFSFIIAIIFVVVLPMLVSANEAAVKAQVEEIANGLMDRLPLDQKIVIKSLSPDETGLPKDFLKKLTFDLESALLIASDFEINLANRSTMEDVWQEAIEFNNSDFDDLYKSSNSDVMLMIAPRALANGVEISITAYALTGDSIGKILASSGSILLPIDLKNSLGVDINDLNKQMAQVLQEIEKVGLLGGLLTSPNTYAEFYHNARLLTQRGEVDLAMGNYEQALSEGYFFVDPLLDLIDLANARYGKTGSKKYFEKKIIESLHPSLQEVIEISLFQENNLETVSLINRSYFKFPPALALWLKSSGKKTKDYRDTSIATSEKAKIDSALLTAIRLVRKSLDRNEFSKYFIDDIRSFVFAEQYDAEALEQELNRAYVHRVNVPHIYKKKASVPVAPILKLCPNRFHIPGEKIFEFDADGNTIGYKALPPLDPELRTLYHSLLKDYAADCSQAYPDGHYTFKVNGQNTTSLSKKDFTYDGEGFSGGPCGLIGAPSTASDAYNLGNILGDIEISLPKRLDNVAFLQTEGLDLLASLTFLAPEIEPFNDYAIYADPCLEYHGASNPGDEYRVPYLGGLIITDAVDQTKPILVHYGAIHNDAPPRPSDITLDGSYISPLGPTIGGGNAEWGYLYQRPANEWLFAPGLLQSSIMQNKIKKIVYTNLIGDLVELTNIEYVSAWSGSFMHEQWADPGLFSEQIEEPELDYNSVSGYLRKQANFYSLNVTESPKDLVAKLKDIFVDETSKNRKFLQKSLKDIGFYNSTIDGSWGKGTESAFVSLFEYLNKFYPDKKYIEDYNLNAADLRKSDFAIFWKAMYGCEKQQLLSITGMCN